MSARKLSGLLLMLSPFIGMFIAGWAISGPWLACGMLLMPFAIAAIISQGLEYWFHD